MIAVLTPDTFPCGLEPLVEEAGLRLQRRRGSRIMAGEIHLMGIIARKREMYVRTEIVVVVEEELRLASF